MYRGLILVGLFIFIGAMIYYQWPKRDLGFFLSKRIKSNGLDISITEYTLKSGLYLKVRGKFIGSDSINEYVFYSSPFGLGPIKEVTPIKKLSTGNNEVSKTEDFFYCLSPKDSLYTSNDSFPMDPKDIIILHVADSLLSFNKNFSSRYKKYYQNFLPYSKLHFSFSDEGLFTPLP